MKRLWLVAGVLVWIVPALSFAEIKVETSGVGADVKDRALVGPSTTFPADIGKVYYHNTLTGDFGEVKLEHVWKRGDDEVGRVSLTAKSPGPWRTWSYKTIPAWAAGTWSVALVDSEGKELAKETFTVRAAEGGDTATMSATTAATPAKKIERKVDPSKSEATLKRAETKTTPIATGTDTATIDDPTEIQVVAASVGTSVKDRVLHGEASSFGKDVGALFCHTTFEGDFPETQVEHVWKLNGTEMSRVSLKAKGPRWRTWSRKTVEAANTGDWTVEVVAGDKTLKTVSFKVQ